MILQRFSSKLQKDRHDGRPINIIMWRNEEREPEAEDIGAGVRSSISRMNYISIIKMPQRHTIIEVDNVSANTAHPELLLLEDEPLLLLGCK